MVKLRRVAEKDAIVRRQPVRERIHDGSNEAGAAFNNAALYVEKFVGTSEHIEIQVFGDQHGNVVTSRARLQRPAAASEAHRRVASPVTTPELVKRWGGGDQGRQGVKIRRGGTIEFRPMATKFYFMEMNTAHPGRTSRDRNR